MPFTIPSFHLQYSHQEYAKKCSDDDISYSITKSRLSLNASICCVSAVLGERDYRPEVVASCIRNVKIIMIAVKKGNKRSNAAVNL